MLVPRATPTQGAEGTQENDDRSDVDERPDLSREVNANYWVVYDRRDAKHPEPARHLRLSRSESEEHRDRAENDPQEQVVPIRVRRVERPKQHWYSD